MNAVTVTNHVVGELMALVVLHEAFGGKALDDDEPFEQGTVDAANLAITIAHATIIPTVIAPAGPDPVDEQSIHAQATLFDSKMQLKVLMAAVYSMHGAGEALHKFPPTTAAGEAIALTAYGLELKVIQEYYTLNALEELAHSISESGLKEFVIDLTGMLMQYERSVVQHAPQKSRAGANRSPRPTRRPAPSSLKSRNCRWRPKTRASTSSARNLCGHRIPGFSRGGSRFERRCFCRCSCREHAATTANTLTNTRPKRRRKCESNKA